MKVLIADKFSQHQLGRLVQLGFECVYDDSLSGPALAQHIGEFRPQVLVVRSTKVDHSMLVSPLEMVVRAGSGYDTIDVLSASAQGISVCNCPGKNAIAVAELVMGLIVSVDRKIPDNVQELRAGLWEKAKYSKAQGLFGKTIGLIGYGNIGKEVGHRARSFGMKVIAKQNTSPITTPSDDLFSVTSDMTHLLSHSDYVSISVPNNAHTKGMVDSQFMAQMKPTACLINSSRADVVNQDHLLAHLKQHPSFFYATDVFLGEPSKGKASFESPLASLPNVYGTHHIGASTQQSEDQIGQEVFDIITSYRSTGVPRNCVNMDRSPVTTACLKINNTPDVLSGVYSQIGSPLLGQDMNTFQGGSVASLTLRVAHTDPTLLQSRLSQLPGVLSCKCS